MEPVADSQNLPAPTVPATLSHVKQTVKDPKKQEAGRKGAEARRQKMEALNAELTAAKETVYSAENNKEYTMLHRNEQQTPEAVSPKREDSHCSSMLHRNEQQAGTGWLVGIGLAVIAGMVLYTRRPVAVPPPERQPHEVQHAPRRATPKQPEAPLRSFFDME